MSSYAVMTIMDIIAVFMLIASIVYMFQLGKEIGGILSIVITILLIFIFGKTFAGLSVAVITSSLVSMFFVIKDIDGEKIN